MDEHALELSDFARHIEAHARGILPSGVHSPSPTMTPHVPMRALDTLWFQVAGTLCNIECTHCFISSSPTNRSHEMLSLETVKRHLRDAEALGVKEYYFTGGEPFMNREIFEILEAA